MPVIRIEVVGEVEDYGKNAVAVVHLNIFEYAKKHNLDHAKNILLFAHEQDVRTIILPYMQPYGPVIDEAPIGNRRIIRKYALSVNDPYILTLNMIARNYGLNIVVAGIIERAGSKIYVSSIMISPYTQLSMIRHRKIIIRDHERKLGISPGKSIAPLKVRDTIIASILDDEFYVPEMIRLLLLENSSFLLYGYSQSSPPKNVTNLVRTYSYVFSVPIIVPGSIIYYRNKVLHVTPTIVTDSEGNIIYKYVGEEQKIIIIPEHLFVASVSSNVETDTLKLIARKYRTIL